MCRDYKISLYLKIILTAAAYFLQSKADSQIYSVANYPHNSGEADFSAVFLGEDIVFCSSRSRKTTNYNQDSVEVFYTDLFHSKYDGSGSYLSPEPLRGDVNTFFNEGHATFSADGTIMYYTANLIKKTGKSKSKTDEYKLGIFEAHLINGAWVKVGEFVHNSVSSKFSTAHPCLADGDSVLYFASNRPGGFGGSDLYRCFRTSTGWSEPQNLGENVNDEGNEFFPFVNSYGTLFFTTDGRYDSEGMDIYSCYRKGKSEFEEAFRLNNTINSAFDELAYSEKHNSDMGCFSSNRNKEQDDIFLFKKTEEQSRQCVESAESINCYRFVDENLRRIENNLPIVYNWELGDGTQLSGDTIEHCYNAPGIYTIVLNALDTLTKMVFSKISEAQVTVADPKFPVIYMPDTVYIDKMYEAYISADLFDKFVIKEIKWQLNEDNSFDGKSFRHSIGSLGAYQLKCEIFGDKNNQGIRDRICLYKNFRCLEVPMDAVIAEPMVDIPKPQPVEVKMNTKTFGNYSLADLGIGDNFYMLIIAESLEPMSFEDSIFKHINAEISEIKTEKGYIYAIERKDNWNELLTIHAELKNKGIITSYAEHFDNKAYEKSVVRTGFYNNEEIETVETIEPISIVKEPSLSESTIKKENTVLKEPATAHSAQVYQPSDALEIKSEPLTAGISTHKKARTLYHIVVESSNERISFEDGFFKNVSTEIAELKSGSTYSYSVLTSSEPRHLESTLTELQKSGYTNAKIQAYDLQEFSNNLLKIGRYKQTINPEALNDEFSKLSDIKFDYNSSEILESSHKSLDYIASILMLEDQFMLKINAHTCNIGNSEYNKKLSEKRAQSVVSYLTSKGISKSRLIASGHGYNKPAASNFTMDGRSTNRRVEFVILYQGNK